MKSFPIVRKRFDFWALAINAAMFAVEIFAGIAAGSVSLQAGALDFLGDAANYAISLAVIGSALRFRARAALIKGTTMALFGLWVLGSVNATGLTASGTPGGYGWYNRDKSALVDKKGSRLVGRLVRHRT